MTNADSLMYQIFLIVMGGLYGMAYLTGISYEAANIYCYFVLYPLSFSLFLKGPKKYLFLPVSLLFFAFPYEELSSGSFDACVDFVNYTVVLFTSSYVAMCVYLCVLLPLLLYAPFLFLKLGRRNSFRFLGATALFATLYLITVYPNMKSWLLLLQDNFT